MEAINKSPRAQRESPILPRASSASEGPIPRSAPYAKRSGIGPQRALEAITKSPRAQRESRSSPELPQRAQDRSRGAPTPRPCSPSPASAKAQPVPTFPPSAINEDYMAFAFGNGIVISSVRWTDGRHSTLRRSHAVKSLLLVRQRFRREQEKARTVIGGRADHGPMGWGQREVGAGQHGEGRAGVVGER